ncbi:purine-binding chemotaxis protein CheW [Natronincola peptidivorans]|uniref:Chemotaxis protein CheW n=2 Tax=Natronincola peptidivorans TaxID=426128 RepID=A0A1H9YG92_9FIRM|nr:purine-binding chemotaxis protein CheW [Natronincola peptidivorans]
MEATNQYVVFKLEEEYYGIDINFVETIERVVEITRLPNAPHYIKGVINLRGEVIPVIDLRTRFNIEDKAISEESRIIILTIEEMTIGLLVDSSSEVLTIEKEEIDNTNSLINYSEDEYIKGIGKVNERMIIILDPMKILYYHNQEG